MTSSIAILGSTGSVGMQALDVAAKHGIRVTALAAGANSRLLEEQVRAFRPAIVGMKSREAAADLRLRIADLPVMVIDGEEAAAEVAAICEGDTVVNAVTGIAGLMPALRALEAGKHVALANKETMVAYGDRVMEIAREKNLRILPVDSEHSAIFQCLRGNKLGDVRRLLITASGGPFYRMPREELSRVTAEMALAHPTWKMGPRITIDSATLMNKGFEVLEARALFGIPTERIEVVIHRESIIHSMVEYNDRAVMAQMSVPDMRLCVQYALSCPDRPESDLLSPLDLPKLGALHFEAPDLSRFPLLDLAFRSGKRGGTIPAVMNAADEVAVSLFLDGIIGFSDIAELVIRVTEDAVPAPLTSADAVFSADAAARERTRELALARTSSARS